MNVISRLILIIIGIILVSIDAAASIGTQEIWFKSQTSDRTIVAEIYYPASCNIENKKIVHGIWLRENYSKSHCDFNEKKSYPLIVFSHGFQGDRFGNSWLAEGLVAKGYIVAMIDHAFNTSYDHSDLFVYTSMWQRPTDISELLTHLLQDPKWGKVIDKNRIAAAGLSLGGATALWLGDIRANKEQFKQTLDNKYSRWSDWPEYAAAQARHVDWSKAELSYKDTRIKAVIAIAPDLGEAFTAGGLKEMQIPALIIVGDKDIVTPKEQNAEFYAKNIMNAEIVVLKDAEHFTFMNHCSSLGFKLTPYLCSSDNKKDDAHSLTISKISDFLLKNFSYAENADQEEHVERSGNGADGQAGSNGWLFGGNGKNGENVN